MLTTLLAVAFLLLCVCGAIGVWQFVWLPEQERRNMTPEEVSRATRLAATFEAATARADAVGENGGAPAGPPTWTPRPTLTASPVGGVSGSGSPTAIGGTPEEPSATPTAIASPASSATPAPTLLPTVTHTPTLTPTVAIAGPVLYVVTVSTGCDFFDATDANVFIRLFGTAGESAAFPLDLPDVNDFRECEFDSYLLNMPADLGVLESVEIWHDNTGFSAGWFLDWVNIRNNVTDEDWYFPCFRWLSTEEEDTSTFRRIFVGGPCE